MYEFPYNYVKPKNKGKEKQCYIDTDRFIVYIKTRDIFKEIAEDVKTRLSLQIMGWIGHYQKKRTRNLFE